MSDLRLLGRSGRHLLPAALGAYAAAIAVAPKPMGALALAAPLVLVPLSYWVILKPNRWLPLFFAAALLLPPLPFGLGNSGPHPALAIVPFGLLAGFWNPGQWRISASPINGALVWLFLILLGSAAEAMLYSGRAVGLGSLARVLLFGIAVYVFFYTAHGPGAHEAADSFAQVRWLYWLAAAGALFACVDFYFHLPAPAGFGPQFIWLASGVYRRAQGLFYEASTLGNFCAFFLAMFTAGLLAPAGGSPLSRRALLPGGIVFSAALVLSFSRASLLNVLVALAALLYLHRRHLPLARIALLFGSIAVAGLAALRWLLPEFAEAYWLRVSLSAQYFFSATEGVLSGRVASWRAVLAFLAAHPWHALFGVGYKTLPYSDYLGRTVITDNMYLSLLAETGIVGLAAMLWLSAAILRTGWRATRSADPRRAFFGSWIFAFWSGQIVQMFSGDLLTYWRVMPIYFWVAALAAGNERLVS